jgi:hypothetical protein
MEDAGARQTGIFTDYGVVTTTPDNGPRLTRALISELAADRPDVIVFELGDGLLGAYGVEAILKDPDVRSALTGLVLCANDPVGAWGGVEILRREFDIEPVVVTGRSTDNEVGAELVRTRMGVAAFNALTQEAELGDCIHSLLRPAEAAS